MSRPSLRWIPTWFVAALVLLGAPPVYAQDAQAPRPLPIEEYDRWRTVTSVELSHDGVWMSYAYDHRVDEDTLQIQNLDSGELHAVPGGSDPAFSDDAKWLAYRVDGTDPGTEGVAGLLDLATGDAVTWSGVDDLEFAPGSRHLVVVKTRTDPQAEHQGADLIIRDLGSGAERLVGGVSGFAFDRSGTMLAYAVDAAHQDGNGVYLVRLGTGATQVLDNDGMTYSRLTWNEAGTALAALKGDTEEGLTERSNSLVAFLGLDRDRHETFTFDPTAAGGFPEGSVLSERGSLTWRDDPSMILVGVKAQSTAPESDPENEPASVVVFHWNDDYIQTVQQRRARFEENFTYRGVVHVPSGRYVQLADATMRDVDVPEQGAWGIGSDERAYISDWEEDRADYYRVDIATGERSLILTAQKRTLGTSPDGRYFAYWLDGHIWVHDLERGEDRNLTASAPVSFVNAQYDNPGTKPPYGLAGWTADGDAIVLNHRYDLWLQPLDGSAASNLTGGAGARDEVRFRYARLDDDAPAIDLGEPILLAAYGQWTKKSGYYELDGGRLTERVFHDRQIGALRKADDADRVIFTSQTFAEYPDYYVSDLGFTHPERITDANPQQAEYTWGHTMLFDFANQDGVRLQGTLAIPDGYEAGQKLPMIVNFYDKKSQNLHAYWAPAFGGSYPSGNAGPVAEFGAWVSNGYLVMQLDVHFNTGTTHSDMLDCVEAATRRVIEMGYADPERIALTGGSFSGGGSAFIATQSDMFAAIVSRAAPINLAGEFNILFSGSGQNNHSYDIYGQGRYGTNPFDDFELYREQSPITHVRSMDTPLLYMHGQQDGSVEYLQGMEFYNALRFLGKPIIFLTYPDEGHNLKRYENQLDFTVRMRQFLDHYLKDAAAPDWMVNGLPYAERGR